jgi:hypothetical protein
MKAHFLYIIIGVLLAGNVALLLKKTPLPDPPARQGEQREFPESVVVLDTLVLRRWSDNGIVKPEFKKPTFLLFFSKTNCESCIAKAVDYLSSHATPTVDTYIISTDIYDPAEKTSCDARFLRSLPFFALERVHRVPALEISLPAFMVVDEKREILFAKQILLSDDVQGDYVFWKRINLLYSLAGL